MMIHYKGAFQNHTLKVAPFGIGYFETRRTGPKLEPEPKLKFYCVSCKHDFKKVA